MKRFYTFILSLSGFFLLAQNGVGPYSWQDHLSMNTAVTVCKYNKKIYASNSNGLVVIDEEEGSTRRLNKSNGLHDVGIKLLRVNESTNKLLIIYENSNIDIIESDGSIKNYPDIKLKSISGKKGINEVFFKDKLAYLASGLGIIVFDTDKLEIRDTYIIGPNGTNLEVYQTAMNDSVIYAATDSGLLRANYKLKILNNYASWKHAAQLPKGTYGGVINVQDKMLAGYCPSKIDPNIHDTLYMLQNSAWSKFYPANRDAVIRKLGYVEGQFFTMFSTQGPELVDVNTKVSRANFTTFNGLGMDAKDMTFFYDGTYISYWIADQQNGLFQAYGSYPDYPQFLRSINGTRKNIISNIDISSGQVAVSPSYPDETGLTYFYQEGINFSKDNNWEYYNYKHPDGSPLFDINHVLVDRKDPTHIWASSWSGGLLEIKDKQLVKIYDGSNSNLTQPNLRASGLAMDKDGNLWGAVSDDKEYLFTRKRDGTIQTYNFQTPLFTRRIMVDRNGYVWATHQRDGGLTVFNPDGVVLPVEGVNYRLLSKEERKGNLGSNSVYCVTEDKDGKIWVGTTEGVRVFYNPSNMFSGGDYDSQPIKIVQDGNVELLLDKETVTAITIDGANNKWIGTLSSGVFCLSPDGITQLYHFTIDNSPLYSNNIIDLSYDKTTGDIYIGMDVGLQSFRSSTIEGDDNYSSIYAYPNPVKPGYNGHVFVRGLVDNSVVKVTDESGNLVWETKSSGGQVEWPLKTLSGARVTTGVYIVYAAVTTAELKAVTKVLVVN